jgi:hypothetical protein
METTNLVINFFYSGHNLDGEDSANFALAIRHFLTKIIEIFLGYCD